MEPPTQHTAIFLWELKSAVSPADLRTLQKRTPERSSWEDFISVYPQRPMEICGCSFPPFTFSGHHASGCTHGSPGFRLWNTEWCHGGQIRILRCLSCNYFPLTSLSARPRMAWCYKVKQTQPQSTWKCVNTVEISPGSFPDIIRASACTSCSPSCATWQFIEGMGITFNFHPFIYSMSPAVFQ